MAIVVPRTLIVAWLSFRGSLVGLRAVALALLAAIPSLIVLAVALSGATAGSTEGVAQSLFLLLTLRVLLLLVLLVVLAGQFRSEIELDTLTFLSTRSISRASIGLGKFLGGVAASLLVLLPAAFVPLGIAGLAGAAAPAAAVSEAIVSIVLLAALAYGAFFLLLGLLSSSALILGLVYGFFWEELLLLLPGQFPKATVLYYLLTVGSRVANASPFSDFHSSVSLAAGVAAPVIVAVFFVAATLMVARYVETAPQRITA